jgi:hypothetical protein
MEWAGSTARADSQFCNSKRAGNCLLVKAEDGFALSQALLVIVRLGNRAFLSAIPATLTLIRVHIAGFLKDGDFKVRCFPLYPNYARAGEKLDIGVGTYLYQFRRKDAHGAVIRGESFVQL